MKTLRNTKAGETVGVRRIRVRGAFGRRLADIGLTRGAMVTVIREAPFGDPMEISIMGCRFALRKADAEMIEVE